MKISTSKEKFVKELQTIQSGMTSKDSSMPILQNFLMETEEGGVRITFTDLEMTIRHFIPLDVIEQGSVTVPIRKFIEIINNLGTKDDIVVSSDESSRITIQSGRSRIKMGGTAKDQYPGIPEISGDMADTVSFGITASKISEMIRSIIFSASNDNDRPNLKGLSWKYNKIETEHTEAAQGGDQAQNAPEPEYAFSMAATDGRRLSVSKTKGVSCGKEFNVIVPSKVLNELTKFIQSAGIKDDALVQVAISPNMVVFSLGKTSFMSRLVDGSFPLYEQIIPKNSNFEAEADIESLLAVTKRASICTSDRTSKVNYSFRKGSLTVSASSQNMEFEDEIPVSYDGDDFDVSFNPACIMDIMKILPAGHVTIRLNQSISPVLMTIKAEDAPIYIVMPLR